MWTRRELMTSGVVAPMASAIDGGDAAVQTADREAFREVVTELRNIRSELSTLADATDMPSGIVTRLRDQMSMFLRANGKFPDFVDVGSSVFYQLYDWHVKHAHPLVVGRQPDGRYALQFMFTRLILRPESDPSHVGPPYDNR